MKQTCISLPSELREEMREEQARLKCSMSALIRIALACYFDKKQGDEVKKVDHPYLGSFDT